MVSKWSYWTVKNKHVCQCAQKILLKDIFLFLFISDPPQNVWLDTPPPDVPLRSGTTVRLVCFSTGGNPTATLTWFKVSVYCMWVLERMSEVHILPCVISSLPVVEWKGSPRCTEADVLWAGCGSRTDPGSDAKWQHGHLPLWCHK